MIGGEILCRIAKTGPASAPWEGSMLALCSPPRLLTVRWNERKVQGSYKRLINKVYELNRILFHCNINTLNVNVHWEQRMSCPIHGVDSQWNRIRSKSYTLFVNIYLCTFCILRSLYRTVSNRGETCIGRACSPFREQKRDLFLRSCTELLPRSLTEELYQVAAEFYARGVSIGFFHFLCVTYQ